MSLATEVASRAGVALSNATRFQREHVVAEVLQRAVLPDSLPDVEGLLLDAEYRAGVAGTYAGATGTTSSSWVTTRSSSAWATSWARERRPLR